MSFLPPADRPDGVAFGVHLVGSIRLPQEPDDPLASPPSTEEVFRVISEALPHRLCRLPDGETGKRHYFVQWQNHVFKNSPWVYNERERNAQSISVPENAPGLKIRLDDPGYDTQAIASYRTFEKLQGEGVIGPDVRFQVCIPTPLNVITRFIHPNYQAEIEPMYEALLLKAIRNLQDQISTSKLAIQMDCALEFAALEGVTGPGRIFAPWFEPSPQAIVDRIVRIGNAVDRETQLGIHLCYGDVGHRHFVEPEDTSKLVNVANLLSRQLVHPLDYVHMPVPKNRVDDAYFAPLGQLQLPKDSKVYLGLVHAGDLEGTRERIAAANKILERFGVGTECGWGRTPVKDVSSILSILKDVTGDGISEQRAQP